jgi:hypothetical protein
MSVMMAIVSKAVFEKDAPKARLGDVLPMKYYRSASKHLERLGEGGKLFLVTVRPPSEALWLVAVLESPQFDGDKWKAAANRYPVTDLSPIIGRLKFESGKGLVAKKGALGMSLQTPRALCEADVTLLLATAGAPPERPPPKVRQARPVNLTKHEASAPLPCLCVKCLPDAPELLEVGGATFFRAQTELFERILWFWVPSELKSDLSALAQSVNSRLRGRIEPYKPKKDAAAKPRSDDEDDDGGDDDE